MREPSWWYGDGAPWIAHMLRPAGALYHAIATRRMAQPPTYQSKVPVICVGNFTAGGTGKTPCVQMLVGQLRASGHHPVVLSRGFGGRIHGPHLVDAAHDTAADVGDEPLLLAATVPVVVARDRAAGADFIDRADRGVLSATVIVMDDGLQNPALKKDLTLAIVDAGRGIGNGYCIPAGPLRAGLQAQLPSVDAIVLNSGNGNAVLAPELASKFVAADLPVLTASLKPHADTADLSGARIFAYCGIGTPERFFASLAAAGANLCGTATFADHHSFTEADAAKLLAQARDAKAQLVTTEKDAVRFASAMGLLGQLRDASRVFRITLKLDGDAAATLAALIAERVPLSA